MPVSPMDSYDSLTCLGHYVGLKRMLQVGNLGQGSEQGGGNTEIMVIPSQASQLGLGKFTRGRGWLELVNGASLSQHTCQAAGPFGTVQH